MYNQAMDRVLYFLTAMTLAVGIALGISLGCFEREASTQ
jgi:hypothetical protein